MPDLRELFSEDDQLHLRVLRATTLPLDSSWNFPDVCSTYWRLYFNFQDGAWLELPGGRRHALTSGRVHLVPAWVRFSCRNRAPLTHFYVHFDVLGLSGAAIRDIFPAPLAVASGPAMAAAASRTSERLAAGEAVGPALRCELKALLYAALAAAFAALPAPLAARCRHVAAGDPILAPALHLIEDRMAEPLPNARLAAACRLAEDHFIRRFRRHLGQTPAQYVLERRIAAAAQRLRFSSDPIAAIASDHGFANRDYFSRMFARRVGCGPASYRRAAPV